MKLICSGDSLTFGYGVRASQRWTHLCARDTGRKIVNEGVSGDTAGGMLARLAARVLPELRSGSADEPFQRILLMGGCAPSGGDSPAGGRPARARRMGIRGGFFRGGSRHAGVPPVAQAILRGLRRAVRGFSRRFCPAGRNAPVGAATGRPAPHAGGTSADGPSSGAAVPREIKTKEIDYEAVLLRSDHHRSQL